MSQNPRYMEDTYCFSIETSVLASGVDEHGEWIALEENIFHPQGGGQPADTAWVNDIAVKIRKQASGLVVAYPQQPLNVEDHQPITATISPGERLYHSALHTAGHLLNGELKPYGWNAISGHHFPGESRVEFSSIGSTAVRVEDLPLQEIEESINAKLRAGAVVTAWREGTTRITLIENSEQILCGGTHVSNINQISAFSLKAAKFKKGTLRVSYDAAYAGE